MLKPLLAALALAVLLPSQQAKTEDPCDVIKDLTEAKNIHKMWANVLLFDWPVELETGLSLSKVDLERLVGTREHHLLWVRKYNKIISYIRTISNAKCEP